MSPGERNIRAVLERVDDIDWREGLSAYWSYQQTMLGLGARFGYTLEQVAGVFSATSPNNDYVGNLRSTAALLAAHRSGVPFSEVQLSTYRACGERAWRVLEGESFLSFTRGPKTRNFYASIVDPKDPHAVTIDGHMIAAWRGERLTMKQAVKHSRRYHEIAGDFRRVAFSRLVLPSQLQAVVWFTWKRINAVLYDGQLRLDDNSDPWGLRPDPWRIEPFARRRSA